MPKRRIVITYMDEERIQLIKKINRRTMLFIVEGYLKLSVFVLFMSTEGIATWFDSDAFQSMTPHVVLRGTLKSK